MKKHPEQREDEVYLGNTTMEGFRACCHKTKRIGRGAYDADGKFVVQTNWVTCIFPFFVKKEEYDKAMEKHRIFTEKRSLLRTALLPSPASHQSQPSPSAE